MIIKTLKTLHLNLELRINQEKDYTAMENLFLNGLKN